MELLYTFKPPNHKLDKLKSILGIHLPIKPKIITPPHEIFPSQVRRRLSYETTQKEYIKNE